MKILRKLFICLVLSSIVQALAVPAYAQGFKWWQTERFKKERIAAHVVLTKGERSELAELAANLL